MTTVSATPLLGTVNAGARIVAVVPAAGNDTDLYVTAIREDTRVIPGMWPRDTYVTWTTTRGPGRAFYSGHYFESGDSRTNKRNALVDMATRAGIIPSDCDDCQTTGGCRCNSD